MYAGVSKNGIQADFSKHGFNLFFGKEKQITNNIHEYGFNSKETFKRAVVIPLYYISRISAEQIVSEHIVNAIRKGRELDNIDIDTYIWEAKSQDCPEKWAIYMDLRSLE